MSAVRHRLPLCLLCVVCAVSVSRADPSVTLASDIGPQPLAGALAAFGRQTGLQLIYVSEVAEAQRSKGARAGLDVSVALTQLLADTGLKFEFLNDRTVRIFPAPVVGSAGTGAAPVRPRQIAPDSAGSGLDVVVVTATRREERVNRVPISMAVWTQESMEESGVKAMEQIGALTPSLDFSFIPALGSDFYTNLGIRGVDHLAGAFAGVSLDDSEIPPARAGTYLRSYPFAFDLERVEILRGPQSTLLGGHTLTGAVRFVMNPPSLTDFSGLTRAAWTTTAHGGPGYEVGAAAGGPIVSNVLGYRVSGWYQEEGGYVDRIDPITGTTAAADSNRHVNTTAHGALTYAPVASVRVTPSLTYQSTSFKDTSTVDLGLSNVSAGEFRYPAMVPQPFNDTYTLASLRVTAALRVVELNSLTSYFDRAANAVIDATPPYPTDYTDALVWYPAIAQRVTSQEVRLSSVDSGGLLSWVAGAYYLDEHSHHTWNTVSNGQTEFDAMQFRQSELDGFGQLTLRLSARVSASAGVRIGHSNYDYLTAGAAVYQGANSENWSAPRYVVSYQADEHDFYYVSAAKGHENGGVYPGSDLRAEPQPYPTSTLWSYEIGSKNDLWNGRMHVDASVFRIHWNNGGSLQLVPAGEQDPLPGGAVSNGFDLSVHALLPERVTMALEVGYANAHLTQTIKLGEGSQVNEGDSLDGRPWSAVASIERNFPLRHDVSGSIRVEDSFHSRTPAATFHAHRDSPSDGVVAGDSSTNVLNLRVGARWPRFEAALFVSNALDAHPMWPTILFAPPPYDVQTITPRTVNISGTWRF